MRRSTEQMLSGMADERERKEASERGLSTKELREARRRCHHRWENKGLYDECTVCGEGRA